MNRVKVIAELGVNHNGQEDLAFELIDKALESGADFVKFQTFNSSNLVSGDAKKASYQEENTDKDISQLEMLRGLELSRDCFAKLKRYSNDKGISFLSTAFDKDSLDFVVNELDVDFLKIASGELTNAPLILDHARTKKDIVLSTGMVALFIYYYGLNKLPASHTTLFELFWPLSAVIIDWIKNGEPLSATQFLGAGMLLSSVTFLTQESSYGEP